jgi:hypothetical protein
MENGGAMVEWSMDWKWFDEIVRAFVVDDDVDDLLGLGVDAFVVANQELTWGDDGWS